MGQTERRQEAHETGGAGGNPPGSVSRPAESQRVIRNPGETPRVKSTVREYAEAIIIAVLLALFIRTFIVQAFKIPSGSMIETLQIGDHILVNKFLYGTRIPFSDIFLFPLRNPERNDVIVFKYPEDPSKDYIKRLIGEPGDIVEVKNKEVYVNGLKLTEPYKIHKDAITYPAGSPNHRDNFGPFSVPEGEYFVMGDNRDRSSDSRFWGTVSKEKIKGKAFLVYWSWDRSDTGVRWNRIGRGIQ